MMLEKKSDVSVKDNRFAAVREMLSEMEGRQYEFAQSRSSFQIEKFIGRDEHTPVTIFRHLSHNAYVMTTVLKDTLLEMERVRRDLEARHAEGGRWASRGGLRRLADRLCGRAMPRDLDIDVYRLECTMTDMEIRTKGLMQELDVFNKLCDELERQNGRPFTYKDFEDDQPEYWRVRLESQMRERQAGAQLGVGEGNFESYLQAVAPPILPRGRNVIRPFLSVVGGGPRKPDAAELGAGEDKALEGTGK